MPCLYQFHVPSNPPGLSLSLSLSLVRVVELVFCANGFLFSLLKKLLLWIFLWDLIGDLGCGGLFGTGFWRICWIERGSLIAWIVFGLVCSEMILCLEENFDQFNKSFFSQYLLCLCILLLFKWIFVQGQKFSLQINQFSAFKWLHICILPINILPKRTCRTPQFSNKGRVRNLEPGCLVSWWLVHMTLH